MFELAGTNFEKGVFELKLENETHGLAAWLTGLGPVRGRLIALAVFLGAAFLLYFQVPARLMMDLNLAPSYFDALRRQSVFVWSIVGLGIIFYLFVLVLRRETLSLVFDRSKAQLRVRKGSRYSMIPAHEDVALFREIEALEVYSATREPKTPNGFMEIRTGSLSDPTLKVCRFKFLTDEQARYFPLNISKIVGIEPKGDWSDPGDLPA